MKTRRSAALFVLLATVASGACRGRDSEAKPAPGKDPWGSSTAARKDPLPHPLLWKIEKAGKTSYALGTFHMGVDPESRLPGLVWQKIDAEPAFAMETDLSDASLAKDIMERDDHKTLHDDLGDAYWKKLEAALTPDVAKRLNRMRPTIAATMLSMRGLPPSAPMDGVLLGHAQNGKKQIAYLEPAAVQVHALVRWMDARALEEMLDDLPYGDQMQKDMLAAYLAGDDAKILKISDAERAEFKKFGRTDAEYDEMMDEMLYRRNASWIDAIEKLHASGGVFIAVGAMHLIGPRSVLALLTAQGYKVTRLTP